MRHQEQRESLAGSVVYDVSWRHFHVMHLFLLFLSGLHGFFVFFAISSSRQGGLPLSFFIASQLFIALVLLALVLRAALSQTTITLRRVDERGAPFRDPHRAWGVLSVSRGILRRRGLMLFSQEIERVSFERVSSHHHRLVAALSSTPRKTLLDNIPTTILGREIAERLNAHLAR